MPIVYSILLSTPSTMYYRDHHAPKSQVGLKVLWDVRSNTCLKGTLMLDCTVAILTLLLCINALMQSSKVRIKCQNVILHLTIPPVLIYRCIVIYYNIEFMNKLSYFCIQFKRTDY